MLLTPTRRKVFILFWAASICWMYVGLLVNFHQHKIWGKELIPQFYFYKRGVDKPFKTWSVSKKSADHAGESYDHFDFSLTGSTQVHPVDPVLVCTIPVVPGETPCLSADNRVPGLRGPPVA